MMSRYARLAAGAAISIGIVVALVRLVDLSAMGAALLAANWAYVVPAIGLYLLGLWARSLRWQVLLGRPHIPSTRLFQALVVGFAANNVLPVRAGEIARAYLLGRWCKVPYADTLTSLIVERVLDGLTLAA